MGGCIRAIPSYMFGVWLFGVRGALTKLQFAGTAFWLSIVVLLVGCCVGLSAKTLILTLYIAVALGVAADTRQRPGRIVGRLAAGGQLTYSSYMLHPLIDIAVLNVIADRISHTHGIGRNVLVLGAFALVWPVSYLSLVFFEKPARRWMGAKKALQQGRA